MMDTASVVEIGRPSVRRDSIWRSLRGPLKGSEGPWALAFVVPYIAVFVTVVAYPVVYRLWMGSEPRLYPELFSDPIYQKTVVNTVLYLALGVNVKLFLALLLSGFFMRPGWWMKVLLMIFVLPWAVPQITTLDRKSTRLNSSHRCISYAVFCLKKKNNRQDLSSQDRQKRQCVERQALSEA